MEKTQNEGYSGFSFAKLKVKSSLNVVGEHRPSEVMVFFPGQEKIWLDNDSPDAVSPYPRVEQVGFRQRANSEETESPSLKKQPMKLSN